MGREEEGCEEFSDCCKAGIGFFHQETLRALLLDPSRAFW
jgi:hypothetical protein